MSGCNDCSNKRARLKCLACEQRADSQAKNYQDFEKPLILKPAKRIPMNALSDEEKACLVLHVVAEMSYHQISNILKLHHSTVKSYVIASYTKLRIKKAA